MAEIIDGKKVAEEIKGQLRKEVEMLVAQKETLAKEYEDRKKELEEKS